MISLADTIMISIAGTVAWQHWRATRQLRNAQALSLSVEKAGKFVVDEYGDEITAGRGLIKAAKRRAFAFKVAGDVEIITTFAFTVDGIAYTATITEAEFDQ